MSGSKDVLEQLEEQRRCAAGIAVKAKVLNQCQAHGDCFAGSGGTESAYRLGNAMFSKGEFPEGLFGTRRELTDAIKWVLEEYVADACPTCTARNGLEFSETALTHARRYHLRFWEEHIVALVAAYRILRADVAGLRAILAAAGHSQVEVQAAGC